MSLSGAEMSYATSRMRRDLTDTEVHMMAAQWSEHCSYKSSRMHLRRLPMEGPLVIREKGYDSGVLDAGGGYVVTVHIESHNHPSAVEPYGGAATGVGGVIRDILSAGTRPIAILDGLRFGDTADPRTRWLFKSAVSGIADYGNCLGIPTVGGEVEFDPSYANYALVDVAAVGFGRRERLIRNSAREGDAVVLIGGPTGRDGIGGSQFASDQLEEQDRSAVQIPDPFAEKLMIEAVLEARDRGLIRAMKDLGGGGLSCAVSETADALSVGISMDVGRVHTREQDMRPLEIMTSESQERMLIVTSAERLEELRGICKKFRIGCSAIGRVTSGSTVHVTDGGATVARLPAGLLANAQLLDRESRRPAYLDHMPDDSGITSHDLTGALSALLSSPNLASKRWVYGQYDHEVGIRTVTKPGHDAAVLRLDNGRFLSVSMDANPKHCYIDPYGGAAGCVEEACRNVACTGGRPSGLVDHLQFGSPEDPEIFWTFLESVRGIADCAGSMGVPCVGGKVSFYNETPGGPIKPTPMIAVLGLADTAPPAQAVSDGDALLLVGMTRDELGGSEYMESIHGFVGGTAPRVDHAESRTNMDAVLDVIGSGAASAIHDCSKGGLGVAVSEMCMMNNTGCAVSFGIESVPDDRALFSETHSRYLVAVQDGSRTAGDILDRHGAQYRMLGRFGGDRIVLSGSRDTADLPVGAALESWTRSLEEHVS